MRLRTHPKPPRMGEWDQFENLKFEDSFGHAGRHGDCTPEEGLPMEAKTLSLVNYAEVEVKEVDKARKAHGAWVWPTVRDQRCWGLCSERP